MAKIFISYRREDSIGVTGRIYDRLRAHFGNDAVFMDIDNIPFGVNFRQHIDTAIGQCDVVLAVIGTKWAGETDAQRRLDDPKDFVRIELESALHRELPVIPILIEHARMPIDADLPASLALFSDYNAIEVDQGRDFHHHVDLLIKGIEHHLQQATIADSRFSSTAPEAIPTLSAGQELAQPQYTTTAEVGEQSKSMQTVEPYQDSPQSASATGQPPNAKPQGAEGLGPEARLMAPEVPEAMRPLRRDPAPTIQQRPAVSSPLHGAAPATTLSSSQPGRERRNSIGMKLMRIDAGEFQMGSTKDQVDQSMRLFSDSSQGLRGIRERWRIVDQLARQFPDPRRNYLETEQPQHRVKISRPFFLGIHEVTQGQYRSLVAYDPSQHRGSDDLPVDGVYWLDAVEFCNKLSEREKRTPFYLINGKEITIVGGNGYRLPTEAEWEYACRATSETLFPFGDDPIRLADHAWYAANADRTTHPVGQKLPNAWGLFDMLGNVGEWCADIYHEKYYRSSPSTDPPGCYRTPWVRVVRGGTYGDGPAACRSACRRWGPRSSGDRDGYDHGNGFRVAVGVELE